MKKMMVVTSVVVMLTGLNILGAQEAQQPGKEISAQVLKKQATCPVMGGAVNTNLYVDYDGKRVYVCCKNCIETVKKDPAKYIHELESKGVTLEKAQTTCPVMGGKIDKKAYVDYNGKRVYFCCAGCIPQFKKDPGTYLKKMGADSSHRSAPRSAEALRGGELAEGDGVVPEPIPSAADTGKKEAPKDTGGQTAPQSEHKHSGGGGCH